MYGLLLCAAIGTLLGAGSWLLGWWGWGWAIPFALIVFIGCMAVLSRVLGRRLTPALQRVQNQTQSGMLDAAMQGLKDLLPLSRWVPLLRGQLLAQMGVIAHHCGKTKEAIELLGQAPARLGDAQMMLAAILWREGDKARAFAVLAAAIRADKRHRLLPNVQAWMLHQDGRVDEAIAALARYTQKQPQDEASRDNLLRLQNRRRLAMDPFGVPWFALQLERPPAGYGELRTVRKGFRTPPKRRGQ